MSSERQNGITMDNTFKEDDTDVISASEEEAKEPLSKINPLTRTAKQDKDVRDGSEEEEEDESESDEELPLGSVEAPVQIMTGKRERKKVERLVIEEVKPKTPEKKFEVPVGKGTKLGEIELIEYQLNKTKIDVLKPLYKFLFGKGTRDHRDIKKHIRMFTGFPFKKDDPEYEKREVVLGKFTMPGLKELCTVLDMEKKGNKDVIMERIMEFCLNPQPSGRKLPEKKKKKVPKEKAVKRKHKSKSDGEGSAKKKKSKKKKAAAGGDASMVSEDGDDVEETEGEELNTTTEDGTEESGVEKMDTGDTEEEDEPKSKKVKTKSTPKPKKEKTPKAKTPKKKMKTPSKQQKKASPTKSASKKTPQKRKSKEIEDADSSDDEPLVKKVKSPPSDKELKDIIKGILKGANLEEVTMKMVCRRVYDTYPDFNLSHKKDFIKTTVREIIS